MVSLVVVVAGKHPKVNIYKPVSSRWKIQVFIYTFKKASQRIWFIGNGAICRSNHTTATTFTDDCLLRLFSKMKQRKMRTREQRSCQRRSCRHGYNSITLKSLKMA